jgi:IMP dehydrogenase
MHVEELVNKKGREIVSIQAGATVEEAITDMAAKKVSALIVMENDIPVGIFAERDVLRCHLKDRDKPFTEIYVNEAMSSKLIVSESEDEISAAMAMMIKADIRHLPVIKDKELIGILTISDLVEHQIGTLTAELHYLQEYITDLHNAELD